MSFNLIKESVTEILHNLPPDVLLVAAAKTRSAEEVKAAIQAGIQVVGYNYVQEAETLRQAIDEPVKWHMIGHLQRNKVKNAVRLFDVIETIDSVRLAREVNKQCARMDKTGLTPYCLDTFSKSV